MALIAARYTGAHTVRLAKGYGAIRDESGTRRDGTPLYPGDVLLLPDREVLGQTFLFDPHGEQPSLDLGVGHVVLPEHVGLSDADLIARGYEFHEGRSDFEAVVPAGSKAKPKTAPTAVPAKES